MTNVTHYLANKKWLCINVYIYILGLGVTKSIEIELYVENGPGSCVIGVHSTQVI